MKLRVRKMLLVVGCGAVAYGAYACGIELEGSTDGSIDAGGSSSSGRPGASTSSGGSTSGANASSSGTPSGSSSSGNSSSGDVADAGPDGPNGPTCSTITIQGEQMGCLPVAGFTNGTFDGRAISCARGGTVPPLVDSTALTADAYAQEGAFWHEIALPNTASYTVTAAVKVTAVAAAGTGAGFSIALLNRNANAGTALPTTGGFATAYGIRALEGFPGVAAMVRSYTSLKLVGSAIPNTVYDPEAGPGMGTPTADDLYTLVVRHDAGASSLVTELSRTSDPTVVGPVTIPLAGTAVEAGSAFVGVTAATGNAYKAEHRLVSLTIERCLP